MRSDSQAPSPFLRWVRAETGNSWKIAGRRVLPSTMEGRLALLAASVFWVPFLAAGAMLASVILLVLAVRKGDRGLLLAVPLLVTVFLVFFVVAEFAIGHD